MATLVPVDGDIEKTLAKALKHREGWWVRVVLDSIEYLVSDYGYQVEAVEMHFRGNYVWFRGSTYRISILYDPDSRDLAASLWAIGDIESWSRVRSLAVYALLNSRDPGSEYRSPTPDHDLTREEVKSTIQIWAKGLRELTPDILSGAWAGNVEWGYLW